MVGRNLLLDGTLDTWDRGGYTETHEHYQNLRHHSKRERERERERKWVCEWERKSVWCCWVRGVNEKCLYKAVNDGYNEKETLLINTN